MKKHRLSLSLALITLLISGIFAFFVSCDLLEDEAEDQLPYDYTYKYLKAD